MPEQIELLLAIDAVWNRLTPSQQAAIHANTTRVEYPAIALTDAQRLLQTPRYDAMMADKSQCLGPNQSTVYPWNVATFMAMTDDEFAGYREKKHAKVR